MPRLIFATVLLFCASILIMQYGQRASDANQLLSAKHWLQNERNFNEGAIAAAKISNHLASRYQRHMTQAKAAMGMGQWNDAITALRAAQVLRPTAAMPYLHELASLAQARRFGSEFEQALANTMHHGPRQRVLQYNVAMITLRWWSSLSPNAQSQSLPAFEYVNRHLRKEFAEEIDKSYNNWLYCKHIDTRLSALSPYCWRYRQ